MKLHLSHSAKFLLLVAFAWLCGEVVTGAAQKKAAAPASATAKKAVRTDTEIPKSVFDVTPNARNPFFPQSAVRPQPPQPQPSGKVPSVKAEDFQLNGITPPPSPKPTAMINGYTFEAGETREIKTLAGEKVFVRCEEIKIDSVIISVDGQRRELKLRFGL